MILRPIASFGVCAGSVAQPNRGRAIQQTQSVVSHSTWSCLMVCPPASSVRAVDVPDAPGPSGQSSQGLGASRRHSAPTGIREEERRGSVGRARSLECSGSPAPGRRRTSPAAVRQFLPLDCFRRRRCRHRRGQPYAARFRPGAGAEACGVLRPGSPRFGSLKPEENFTYRTVQFPGSIAQVRGVFCERVGKNAFRFWRLHDPRRRERRAYVSPARLSSSPRCKPTCASC